MVENRDAPWVEDRNPNILRYWLRRRCTIVFADKIVIGTSYLPCR